MGPMERDGQLSPQENAAEDGGKSVDEIEIYACTGGGKLRGTDAEEKAGAGVGAKSEELFSLRTGDITAGIKLCHGLRPQRIAARKPQQQSGCTAAAHTEEPTHIRRKDAGKTLRCSAADEKLREYKKGEQRGQHHFER